VPAMETLLFWYRLINENDPNTIARMEKTKEIEQMIRNNMNNFSPSEMLSITIKIVVNNKPDNPNIKQ
jgi:hypothetical protein